MNGVLFREAVGSYAENQNITAVRKVYQKGIMTPMISVELLWKDYCSYEMVDEETEETNRSYLVVSVFRTSIQCWAKTSSKVVHEIFSTSNE